MIRVYIWGNNKSVNLNKFSFALYIGLEIYISKYKSSENRVCVGENVYTHRHQLQCHL